MTLYFIETVTMLNKITTGSYININLLYIIKHYTLLVKTTTACFILLNRLVVRNGLIKIYLKFIYFLNFRGALFKEVNLFKYVEQVYRLLEKYFEKLIER